MPERGKRPAPQAPAAARRGRGGGGRGGGRKASAVNRPGVDSEDAPKRKQLGLGDLLGERYAKKAKHGAEGAAGSNEQPVLEWDHVRHSGGEEDEKVPQRQRRLSKVKYDFADDSDDEYTLLSKGPIIKPATSTRTTNPRSWTRRMRRRRSRIPVFLVYIPVLINLGGYFDYSQGCIPVYLNMAHTVSRGIHGHGGPKLETEARRIRIFAKG